MEDGKVASRASSCMPYLSKKVLEGSIGTNALGKREGGASEGEKRVKHMPYASQMRGKHRRSG